ncbi:MAG: very short patch repair endonuclease [Methylococcales bacterium]
MDRLTKEKRSWNMSRIRSGNTNPEKQVRSLLHRAGYRFRIHARKLPGRPDIVLPKYTTAIFVHGCFWHRHQGCQYAYKPKSRTEFWEEKFKATVERDRKKAAELRSAGWQVIMVWECELEKNAQTVIHTIREKLKGDLDAS